MKNCLYNSACLQEHQIHRQEPLCGLQTESGYRLIFQDTPDRSIFRGENEQRLLQSA